MLPTLRTLPIVLAAAGLMAPAAANAATKPVYPVVDSISPRKLAIGDTLVVKGKNLRAGAGKTTVVFQRTGKPAVFVKALSSTKTRVTLRVPEKLQAFLVIKAGQPAATTFRMRVLTTRFAKAWTSISRSPVISPKAVAAPPATTPGGTPGADGTTPPPVRELTPYEICQRDAPLSPTADADTDGMSNGLELGLVNKTDPCTADSDADGMVDGYEYLAAIDLNGKALPYPGKRPYPNPLDSSDKEFDFDGDGLQLFEEYALWKHVGGTFPLTAYSDGDQNSGGYQPVTTPEQVKLDMSGDGNLTDDERDADNDGLSNQAEMNMTGLVDWWTEVDAYKDEKPYAIAKFVEPSAVDPDTDGDGLVDGLDDQDHDGVVNWEEMQYPARNGPGHLRVQPYNPCLPNPYSLTCSRWLLLGTEPWPPFDGSALPYNADPTLPNTGSAVPLTWPLDASSLTTDPALAWNGKGGKQGAS